MLHSRFNITIFFIPLFFYTQLSYANSVLTTHKKMGNEVQQSQHSDFITSLPYATTTEILQQINNTRSALSRRKAALSKTEKERAFTTKDSVISIILPGGLLYAAIIKLRHTEVKSQLHNVTKQLNELNQDLIEFRSLSINNTLLATLH
ncbi:MAG: hypothetical protein L3J26_08850 [Candidatus Polarisedimenticolaceae bacterium]|nr:hypothetical protein [Candidatus Polarisedimenticolaceae bacterium]